MRTQYALPLALLFIALGVSSNAQKGSVLEERRVTVEEGAPLTVECALRVEERIEWRLNGSMVPSDLHPAGESPGGSSGRLSARLQAETARAQHAGVYTCTRPAGQRVHVVVRAAPSRPSPSAPSPDGETTPSAGQPSPASAEASSSGAGEPIYYDVGRPFFLNCSMAQYPRATTYLWKKNDTTLDQVPTLLKRFNLEEGGSVFRIVGKSTEEDYGNYTCLVEGTATRGFDVRGRPFAKLPHNVNVVEKQKLKILCKVTGKPYPGVFWTFTNATHNGTDVSEVFGERVQLRRSEHGVERGELVIEEAERSDAGVFNCTPAWSNASYSGAATLRVKDKFAALWPFLGICAEVFVLCAIILVYEKRRTKPELDDSDTDNHDQKKS